MNDAQKAKMVEALADAFDRAAMKSSTKWHAAGFIIEELTHAGYKIAMRANAVAKAPRSNSGKAGRPSAVRRSTSRAA